MFLSLKRLSIALVCLVMLGSAQSCLRRLNGTSCVIYNKTGIEVKVLSLVGYVEFSDPIIISPGGNRKIVSTSTYLEETLTIHLEINGATYIARTPYVQDYSSIIVEFLENGKFSVFDSYYSLVYAHIDMKKQ